jgi:hypothetical protein
MADENNRINFVGQWPMKIRDVFSSAQKTNENGHSYFRRLRGLMKI